MKVHGYTQMKSREAVSMTEEEIVRLGIDPWRIDLFDPDPILHSANEQEICFRKLRDCAFAYQTQQSSEWFIIMHDGKGSACLRGTLETVAENRDSADQGSWDIRFVDIKQSGRPFEDHLLEYLIQWNNEGTASCLRPAWASAVGITGSSLCLHNGHWIGARPAYTGEMLVNREAFWPLPDYINWVLEVLQGLKPIVSGTDFNRVLLGWKNIARFDVYLEQASIAEAHQRLSREEGTCPVTLTTGWGEYKRGEYSYRLLEKKPGINSVFDREWKRPLQEIVFSSDCLSSRAPNSITGPRISLFDIAKRRTRPLSPRALWETHCAKNMGQINRVTALERDKLEVIGCLPEEYPS
jgi:hypothetical protein